MNIRIFILVLISALTGCSSLTTPKVSDSNKMAATQTARVVNAEHLKEGGRLLIVPFNPGVDVEANEYTDKVALMIIRGISDVFKEQNFQDIEILTAENAQDPDLIMRGYITEMKNPSGVKSFFLNRNNLVLSVEAKIIDPRDDTIVLFFRKRRQSHRKGIDHMQLGHIIGQDIAHYILKGVGKEQ